jgi:hypothetical protein
MRESIQPRSGCVAAKKEGGGICTCRRGGPSYLSARHGVALAYIGLCCAPSRSDAARTRCWEGRPEGIYHHMRLAAATHRSTSSSFLIDLYLLFDHRNAPPHHLFTC